MFKNTKLFAKTVKTMYKFPSKNFSGFNQGGSNTKTYMYGLLGLSTAGLSYLCFRNWTTSSSYAKALVNTKESFNNNIVNERTKSTMVYFSSGLALTAGLTFAMAKSGRLLTLSQNPILSFGMIIPTALCIYKIATTPVSSPTKPLYFLGFNACMAFSLAPICYIIPLTVLKDAGLLTSGVFAGLGLVAANSRDDAFLGMSGLLGAGLGGMIALSFANIFLNSPVIFNIWLYGGLALFTAFALYDIKMVQIKAKKEANFDPMYNSIHVYLDFINLFIRIAYILNNRKK
jgi:FtsH-binding integral membrane protein